MKQELILTIIALGLAVLLAVAWKKTHQTIHTAETITIPSDIPVIQNEYSTENDPNINLEPNWLHFPPIKASDGPGIYYDVLSHLKGNSYRKGGPVTIVHENCHLIESQVEGFKGHTHCGLYCLNDKAILIPYPKCHLNDVKLHIPDELNNATLDRLYITSPDVFWKTRVLYILKEWRAYINEDHYCVEVNSDEKNHADHCILHFSVYSLAMIKAISETDPGFLPSLEGQECIRYIKYSLQETYDLSIGHSPDTLSHELWDKFSKGKAGEKLRVYSGEILGKAWSKKFFEQ